MNDVERPESQPKGCQLVEATTSDGQPVTFAVHTVAGLTPAEQAQLGAIAKTVAERELRENPHGGVITELRLASLHSRLALDKAGHGEQAERLGRAINAAVDVIRAARGDRASRFAWAAEADRLDAELAAERLAHAGTQGERDAADDFASLVRGWLDVPDEPGRANVVYQRIAELRADAAASEASLDYVRTSLIEHLDIADELALPDVLAAVPSVVDERDAGRMVLAEVAELLALPGELGNRPAPSVVELARWAKAALDGWEQRLTDVQAEVVKRDEVHERQLAGARRETTATVAAELDRLAGQIEREAHTPDTMAAQGSAMAALDDAVRQGALAMAKLLRVRARELRGGTQ